MLNLRVIKLSLLSVALSSVAVAQAAEITGAGASFPAPLYAKWAEAYKKASGNQVNYQSIGSSAGLQQITAKTVDFGASDKPLSADELKAAGLTQFPTVIGGIVPVVNLEGVKPGQLHLDGELLADIYLGKITRWDDPAIKALNPELKLPAQEIAVVRRADGSGTSFIFTDYLSKASEQWRSQVGAGTVVQWPTGLGGKGNEGVAAFLQRIPNSIGYVEYAYAKQNKLAWSWLKNAAGEFVKPEQSSFMAAAGKADWSRSAFAEILTNQPGKNAWPITGATFVLLNAESAKPEQKAQVLKFFDWAYAQGGQLARDMDYAPLPSGLVRQIQTSWQK